MLQHINYWIRYLFRPTRLSYCSSKLSNVSEKIDCSNQTKLSGSGGIFAGAGFLLDFGKSAGFRPELKSDTALILYHFRFFC